MNRFVLCLLSLMLLLSCSNQQLSSQGSELFRGNVNNKQLLLDLRTLASEAMGGRETQTLGSKKAQSYIISRFKALHLKAFDNNYRQKFLIGGNKNGVNLIAYLSGSQPQLGNIVITAHYDHLGRQGKKIYYGADDNASGVASMLALAEVLSKKQLRHNIIFIATDAEELGLLGAKAWLAAPPVALDSIKLNINLDMLSQGGSRNRLLVAGSEKHPRFKKLLTYLADNSAVRVQAGHDGKERRKGRGVNMLDWRKASDHAPFAEKNIPYLYFGVDLHRYYHKTSDKAEYIDPRFFTAATETVLASVKRVDEMLALDNLDK